MPKKVARTRKDGHVRARDEDDDTLLLDKAARRTKSSTQLGAASQHSQSQSQILRAQSSQQAKKVADDSETESETEPEEEEELLLDKKPTNRGALPTPAPEEPDRGQAHGRIVGSTYPLEDFKANIARGDVVTKAVEDLGAVINEIVLRPFASRRAEEMIQCMRELRQVCLEEDEIDAWNACVFIFIYVSLRCSTVHRFLRALREACLDGKPGNNDFWSRVKDEGRTLSLISETEASELGGKSDVSESKAAEVRFLSPAIMRVNDRPERSSFSSGYAYSGRC